MRGERVTVVGGGDEYVQNTLCTVQDTLFHNELHYYIQVIYANKNKKGYKNNWTI